MAGQLLQLFLVTVACLLGQPESGVLGQVNEQSTYFPLLMPDVQPLKVSVHSFPARIVSNLVALCPA